MWRDILVPGSPIAEKLLRTVAVYGFLLVGLRLAGKRELGQLNPFDLVVLLLLSNTVQNAIIGNDNSLIGGVVGATVLLALNWAVVKYLYTHPKLARVFEGDVDVLIRHGKVHEPHLKRELITRAELEAAARRQGIDGLEHVETCRLEIGGALTFVPKTPNDEERRHAEILQQLQTIAAAQQQLAARLGAVERANGAANGTAFDATAPDPSVR